MNMETWKPVVGYEELYEVSDLGRVRSVDRITPHGHRRRGKLMRAHEQGTSRHLRINLTKHNVCTPHFVHTLVLEAFVGPRPPGMMCRHYPDRNTANNTLGNLSWGTAEDNVADREMHGTTARGERQGRAVLTVEKVRLIRDLRSQGGSVTEIATRVGASANAVLSAAKGRTWNHVK